MSGSEREQRIQKARVSFDEAPASRRVAALQTFLEEVCDDSPASQKAAASIVSAVRPFSGNKGLQKAVSKALTGKNTSSAKILLNGILGVLGGDVEAFLKAYLKSERREIYDGVFLDRILTAVSWQRNENLTKAVKRLAKKLQDGQISRGGIGLLETLNEFSKNHRKVTKVQKQQLADLFTRLAMNEERIVAVLSPFGVDSTEALTNGEARRLIGELSQLVAKHNANAITSKQVNYIRRLVKQLGLDDEAMGIIAQEVGKKSNIVELDKDQGSMIIEWLLEQTPPE